MGHIVCLRPFGSRGGTRSATMNREGGQGGQGDDSVWIPVTVYLPLGFSKPWSPSSCLVPSMGPFIIIFFAQLANTVLVPILPFLVTEIGADPVAYGALQSAYWIAEMVGAPVLGYLSDYIGKRPVIFIALVISA